MTAASAPQPDLAHRLSFTRLLDAPRELVFRTWTEIAHVSQWCHLTHLPTTHMEMDVRVGGTWLIRVTHPDGKPVEIRRVYKEITPPSKLVMTEICNHDGRIALDGLLTFTFTEEAGKTRLTIDCELAKPFDRENQDGWNGGWGDIVDKLSAYLPRA